MEENLYVINEIARMKEIKKYAAKELKRMPEGTLRISTDRNGNPRYYHYVVDKKAGNHMDKYISKRKNLSKIKKLAQKDYLEKIVEAADENLRILSKTVPDLEYEDIDNVFENLSPNRKQLVTSLDQMNLEKANQWAAQPFIQNPYHPEKLICRSERGEMVRSKSEGFIADKLFMRKNEVVYKYEAPQVIGGKTIYPDFTIMRIKDCKIFYWEHAGMMDDPDYVERHIKKINDYIKADIFPGEQLIVTYETGDSQLDRESVNKLLDYYF